MVDVMFLCSSPTTYATKMSRARRPIVRQPVAVSQEEIAAALRAAAIFHETRDTLAGMIKRASEVHGSMKLIGNTLGRLMSVAALDNMLGVNPAKAEATLIESLVLATNIGGESVKALLVAARTHAETQVERLLLELNTLEPAVAPSGFGIGHLWFQSSYSASYPLDYVLWHSIIEGALMPEWHLPEHGAKLCTLSGVGVISSLVTKEAVVSVQLPFSMRYSAELLERLKSRDVVALCSADYLPSNIPREYAVERRGGAVLLTTRPGVISLALPEFPWHKLYAPPFRTMYNNIRALAERPPLSWSIPRIGFNLGVVTRSLASNYFMEDVLTDVHAEPARMKCNEMGHETPLVAWDKIVLAGDSAGLSTDKQRELVYKRERGCNLFSAAFSAYIMSKFGRRGDILDFSSGWGDRAIGAMAAGCRSYTGWDPNPDLAEVYALQIEECRSLGATTEVAISNKPVETAYGNEELHAKFDLCIWSPPFFTKEIYTGEETSTTLYADDTDWFSKFFIPGVENAYRFLRQGGYLFLYIPPPDVSVMGRMFSAASGVLTSLGAQEIPDVLGFAYLTENEYSIRSTYAWRKLPIKKRVTRERGADTAPTVYTRGSHRVVSGEKMPAGLFSYAAKEWLSILKPSQVTLLQAAPTLDLDAISWACKQLDIPCALKIAPTKLHALSHGADVEICRPAKLESIARSKRMGFLVSSLEDASDHLVRELKPLLEGETVVHCYNTPSLVAALKKLSLSREGAQLEVVIHDLEPEIESSEDAAIWGKLPEGATVITNL